MDRLAPLALLTLPFLAACGSDSADTAADRAAAVEHAIEAPTPPRAVEAPNFMVLDDHVAGAGQPALEEIPTLPEKGYSTIVNLRTPGEPYVDEERRLAEEAGLDYVHIPILPQTMSLADAQELADAIAEAEGNVLIHCASGHRVGALWALEQGLTQGLTPEQAKELAWRSSKTMKEPTAERVAELLREAGPR